jgi:hypothetical protein
MDSWWGTQVVRLGGVRQTSGMHHGVPWFRIADALQVGPSPYHFLAVPVTLASKHISPVSPFP